MLVLCSVSPGKEGLITDLKQKSSDYFLCVFVPYRYSDSGNLTAGRCPGSKALVFYRVGSRVTVPNVNIGDCDYTIAFWIRFLDKSFSYAKIFGSSRSGKPLALFIHRKFWSICLRASLGIYIPCMDAFSSGVDMNKWTHVAVTCEQDNRVKAFFNGEITNIATSFLPYLPDAIGPKETFFIDYYTRAVIMDFHILGFALPRDEIYDLYRG